MNKVIQALQWVLRAATTVSEWAFKIPVWILKLIPGMKDLMAKLEGYKTVIANFCLAALAFMEGMDWVEIGGRVCGFVNLVLGWVNVNWVCDPSWIPQIAVIFVAMINLALRKVTTGPIPKK